MRELIEELKEDWLYYLIGFILLLFMVGVMAFIVFLAFLTAISLM